MTQKTVNGLGIFWEAVKGVLIGISVFIGTGILSYQKKSYDWQIEMDSRMRAVENNEAVNSKVQENVIVKQQVTDKNLALIFGHFKLTLLEQ